MGVVDTGVDKNEEDERHLQAVLSASASAVPKAKQQDAYIPTPPASKKWKEYKQFYTTGWIETESYIRSSATVEDAEGNVYNMDEVDSEYLDSINDKVSDPKQKCSEDEFEMICSLLERIVAEKQPFLTTDYTQLMSYEELTPHIVHVIEEQRQALRNPLSLEKLLLDSNSADYAPNFEGSPYRATLTSLKLFGPPVYEHWRKRKLEAKGKSIFPALRYESGLSTDDGDPYVCFRHREVRQSRKTRRTDQQNIVRIRRLHHEMQSAGQILEMVLKRERSRLNQIQGDFEIFELRCRVKALKRKLKIGPEPDDVQLMVSSTKRARQEKQAKLNREAHEREKKAKAAQEKLEREKERREQQKESARASSAGSDSGASERKSTALTSTGSRIPDLEHVTVEQQTAEISMALEKAINARLQKRRESKQGWVDVPDSTYLPAIDFFRSGSKRIKTNDENMVQPKSKNSLELSEPSQLKRVDYVADLGVALDSELQEQDRLQLPLDIANLPFYETPEVLQINNRSEVQKFGERDFEQDSTRFSVPRDTANHLLCRKRKYGNMEYIDRIFPKQLNPLARFHQDLADSCSAGVASEADERLADRFKFDAEYEDEDTIIEDLCNDPAKLNNIDPAKQNLQFNAMLNSKAIRHFMEIAVRQRLYQQAMIHRQKVQLQQRAQAEAQAQRLAQATQTNIRMQQAQRTMQRQQLRKQRADAPGGAGFGAAPGGMNGHGPNGNQGGPSNTKGDVNGNANNSANGNATSKPNDSTNGSANPNGNTKSNGDANGSANASANASTNGNQSRSSSASEGSGSSSSPNQSESAFKKPDVTPQPPKLEAGG